MILEKNTFTLIYVNDLHSDQKWDSHWFVCHKDIKISLKYLQFVVYHVVFAVLRRHVLFVWIFFTCGEITTCHSKVAIYVADDNIKKKKKKNWGLDFQINDAHLSIFHVTSNRLIKKQKRFSF